MALASAAVQVAVHRHNPKILELVSLAFFIFDFVALYLLRWATIGHYQGLLVHLLLASIAWGSLLAGTPFTLQYARESVPRERWQTPGFVRSNQLITGVWGSDFILQALVLQWQAAKGGMLASVFSVSFSALAIAFTLWYPERARRQYELEMNTVNSH